VTAVFARAGAIPASSTLALATDLIRRASVTPDDAGCQAVLGERLSQAGFRLEWLPFGEVTNLWARRGEEEPLFAFAGHTDVVPPGPAEEWSTPPFEAVIHDGMLHGRGAADMKGSLAAMVTACERYLAAGEPSRGSIAFLLTSDEEGPALDGTRRVVETLAARGESMRWCVVGEPSSRSEVGDVVRHGRRGSLNGHLTVHGVQGHVAYPDLARNPIHEALPALDALCREVWDEGNADFPPTRLQIANLFAGTGATNVIPGSAAVDFNLRYSTVHSASDLRHRIERILDDHGLDYDLAWTESGQPFLTPPGALREAVAAAVAAVRGRAPEYSTGGGTSDARFIAPLGTEVVELGPVNATIHQANERVSVAGLDELSALYEDVLERLLPRT
jgi:succinyl-diaminopimelate desuccinylase